MQIFNNIIQQLQQQNNALLQVYKTNTCKCACIQLLLNPIDRTSVDTVYNMISSPQFRAERKAYGNPNNLNVIIDSNGGDADAAYHIAKLLHTNFTGTIKYIIPRFAKSAATLLVCGGDKIVMGETSELGPLDPQIPQQDGTFISAKAVQSTLELIKGYLAGNGNQGLELATILSSRINPLVLGQYDSTLKIAREYQTELLKLRMFKGAGSHAKVQEIVDKFAVGYTHHSRVISGSEAKSILGEDKVEILPSNNPEWQVFWQFYQNYKAMMDLAGVLQSFQLNKINSNKRS